VFISHIRVTCSSVEVAVVLHCIPQRAVCTTVFTLLHCGGNVEHLAYEGSYCSHVCNKRTCKHFQSSCVLSAGSNAKRESVKRRLLF
jgi:hypothetical protein